MLLEGEKACLHDPQSQSAGKLARKGRNGTSPQNISVFCIEPEKCGTPPQNIASKGHQSIMKGMNEPMKRIFALILAMLMLLSAGAFVSFCFHNAYVVCQSLPAVSK